MKLLRNKITVGILIASQFMYGVPVYAEKYTSEPTSRINGRAPVASNLAFDKLTPTLGDTVTLSYDFSDLDGDLEQGTTVQWLRNGQPIQGATSFSYTVDETQGDRPGERLSAEVTPKTNPTRSEPSVGQVASLETTVQGHPAAAPQVMVTNITGTLNVGNTLTGVYEYQDGGSGSGDASIKSWLNGGHGGTGNEDSYLLADDDAGKVLTFQVQAKNLQGIVGNTDSMDTATATGVNGGGQINPGEVVDPAAKPKVSDLDIVGTLSVGETLIGKYVYDDNKTGSGDASKTTWLNGGHASTDVNYVLAADDAGKVLTFEVEAKNKLNVSGNIERVTTTAATGVNGGGQITPGEVVDPAAKPQVSDLKISGTLNVGESLTGRYSYDANGTGSNDASTYSWGQSGQSVADVGANPIAISGEVPSYLIAYTDAGKALEFSVQAKNLAAVVGNTLTTLSTAGATGGGTGGTVINPAAAPAITNLSLRGKLEVGQNLTATYTFNANNGDPVDKSTYVWGYQGTTRAAVLISGNVVRASGNVPSRLLSKADVGKVMEVSVIARNNATIPLAGNSLTRDSSDDFIGGGIVPVNLLSLYSIIKGEKSHGEAIVACLNGGLRPASVSELKDLYKSVAGNVLGEMCTEHGWPLYKQCGGTNSDYWAGDYNSGLFFNEYVNMYDGKEGTTQTNKKMGVVCRDL